MAHLLTGLEYTLWFLLILTVVVFIHEFGHYLVARLNGVYVEVFSIGFGKSIYHFVDRHGTRWQLSLIPLGGYVKMMGDSDPASTPDATKLDKLSLQERKRSLHYQSLWRKAAIVFAGPAFNYLSAFLIIAGMLFIYGKPVSEAIVSSVLPESAAAEAGILPGDKILEADGHTVSSFEDIRKIVALNVGTPLTLIIERNTNAITITAVPKIQKTRDAYGNPVEMPILGLAAEQVRLQTLSLPQAFLDSGREVYQISYGMLKAIGQIITGDRSIKQLGGPIKIAQYSGQSARYGLASILWFIALISINLGLINLLPIPMLDGGHLAYYAVEACTGKPVAEKFQFIAMRVSLLLLMGLMVFITYHDITSLIATLYS